jgi:hypothetical protein
MLTNYDVIRTNGIHITASRPVSVYGSVYMEYASTAFTGYPTPLLGTNYCVMARASMIPPDSLANCYSQFAIVGTANNTTVTITPSPTAHLAGTGHSTPYTKTLQPGWTYQINSSNYTGDVTGTRITSDKPIVVIAGANMARVPDSNFTDMGYPLAPDDGNPLGQEQMPVASWGTNVVALGFADRTGGDLYRVLAVSNNTVVTITTSSGMLLVTTLAAGGICETNLVGPVQFQGTKPIQVAQFENIDEFDDQIIDSEGDPCEILLPPAGHYLTSYTIDSLYYFNNYLNLIVNQSGISTTMVDNVPVDAANFVAIGSSGYYGAQVPVAPGTHTVNSSQPVEVQVYGLPGYDYWDDAYGYLGGIVNFP